MTGKGEKTVRKYLLNFLRHNCFKCKSTS